MDPRWVRDLRDACADSGTAFFFKQWGGQRPKSNGRELDGQTWDQMPEIARA
jgi:protein gp37